MRYLIVTTLLLATVTMSQAEAGKRVRRTCANRQAYTQNCYPTNNCYSSNRYQSKQRYCVPTMSHNHATVVSTTCIPYAQPVMAAKIVAPCDDCGQLSMDVTTPTPDNVASPSSTSTPSWSTVQTALGNYIARSPDMQSVCDIKAKIPEYGTLINALPPAAKVKGLGNATVCFPNQAKWNSDPSMAAKIVSLFKANGVLN